jgi:hypothetical protein
MTQKNLKAKEVSGLSRVGVRFLLSLGEDNHQQHEMIRKVHLRKLIRVLKTLELVDHMASVQEVITGSKVRKKRKKRRRIDWRKGGKVLTRPHCYRH